MHIVRLCLYIVELSWVPRLLSVYQPPPSPICIDWTSCSTWRIFMKLLHREKIMHVFLVMVPAFKPDDLSSW